MSAAPEIREYFSAYVVSDAELAARLADAPVSVHRGLILWVIEEVLGAFPYSPKVAPLLKRRLAGEEVPTSEWEGAGPPPYKFEDRALVGEELQQGYAEDAARGAREDHLIGVAQVGGLIMMEKADDDTVSAKVAASTEYNDRFRAKVVELLSGGN